MTAMVTTLMLCPLTRPSLSSSDMEEGRKRCSADESIERHAAPRAMLIALGAKRVETRSWSTSYRGPLAIHASSRINREAAMSLDEPSIQEALAARGYHQGSGPASNPCGLPVLAT